MNTLMHFGLSFSQEWLIIPTFLLGYIFHKRDLFLRAMVALLLSSFINTYLKTIFAIPLLSHLGPGYAFPSGHMQATVVFWGYLISHSRIPIFRFLGLIIAVLQGCALVYFNYHHWQDVIAAFFVGLGLIIVIRWLEEKIVLAKHIALFTSLCSILCLILLSLINPLKSHLWLMVGTLIGINLGVLMNVPANKSSLPSQCVEVILIGSGAFLAYLMLYSVNLQPYLLYPQIGLLLPGFLMGFWVLTAPKFVK